MATNQTMPETTQESQALAPVETSVAMRLLDHAPAEVLAAAREAAVALRDVLAQKPRKVVMNGEQYLEFEDWQTLGRFYGITAKEDGEVEFVDFAGVQGFKASAEAIDRDGRVLSRATAFCLNDEEKWGTRPKYEWVYALRDGGTSVEDPGFDNIVWIPNPKKPGKNMPKRERMQVGEERVPMFQLASMAQTRANAKVLRNVLSWVAVLAGYRPTPAEEIEEIAQAQRVVREPQASREPGEDDLPPIEERAAVAGAEPNPDYDPQAPPKGPVPDCPMCGKRGMRSKFPKADAQYYCTNCGTKYA